MDEPTLTLKWSHLWTGMAAAAMFVSLLGAVLFASFGTGLQPHPWLAMAIAAIATTFARRTASPTTEGE